jgi:hypothetical protein
MASFVPLHGSWCWFKMKARARKVPGRARASDEVQARRLRAARRPLPGLSERLTSGRGDAWWSSKAMARGVPRHALALGREAEAGALA